MMKLMFHGCLVVSEQGSRTFTFSRSPRCRGDTKLMNQESSEPTERLLHLIPATPTELHDFPTGNAKTRLCNALGDAFNMLRERTDRVWLQCDVCEEKGAIDRPFIYI